MCERAGSHARKHGAYICPYTNAIEILRIRGLSVATICVRLPVRDTHTHGTNNT